jgi:hypothetical protein
MSHKSSRPLLTDAPGAQQHDSAMTQQTRPVFSTLAGQSFRDGEGHRWVVKGQRPGPEGQFVIEAEMKGSYPRVAVYTMTEPEFREHARVAALKPERR